jgi:hypothetical protein
MSYPMLDAYRVARASQRLGQPESNALVNRLLRRFKVVDFVCGDHHTRMWYMDVTEVPPRITQDELRRRLPMVRR